MLRTGLKKKKWNQYTEVSKQFKQSSRAAIGNCVKSKKKSKKNSGSGNARKNTESEDDDEEYSDEDPLGNFPENPFGDD